MMEKFKNLVLSALIRLSLFGSDCVLYVLIGVIHAGLFLLSLDPVHILLSGSHLAELAHAGGDGFLGLIYILLGVRHSRSGKPDEGA